MDFLKKNCVGTLFLTHVCFRNLQLFLMFFCMLMFCMFVFILSQSGTKRTVTGDAAHHAAAVERGKGEAERGEVGNAAVTARTSAIGAG